MISIPGVLPAVPFRTTELLNHRVLALAPHPDDETLGCGGSLILHVRHRDPVKVVILTNGVRGDTKRQYQADEYVARRRQEARQACHAVLGVTDLEFWEYEDGALAVDESTLTRLQRLLLEYQPTLVYVPSPQEYHPDHRVTAFMLYAVVRRLPKELLVAFYEFDRPIHVNTLIDISAVVDEKRRACDMYATQLENYPYTDCALGLNRYRVASCGTCRPTPSAQPGSRRDRRSHHRWSPSSCARPIDRPSWPRPWPAWSRRTARTWR
jgi:N-acetylglucosamine malate deacetylase 1